MIRGLVRAVDVVTPGPPRRHQDVDVVPQARPCSTTWTRTTCLVWAARRGGRTTPFWGGELGSWVELPRPDSSHGLVTGSGRPRPDPPHISSSSRTRRGRWDFFFFFLSPGLPSPSFHRGPGRLPPSSGLRRGAGAHTGVARALHGPVKPSSRPARAPGPRGGPTGWTGGGHVLQALVRRGVELEEQQELLLRQLLERVLRVLGVAVSRNRLSCPRFDWLSVSPMVCICRSLVEVQLSCVHTQQCRFRAYRRRVSARV